MTEIVSFVNRPYLGLLDIWVHQSRPFAETAPTIVCTDADSLAHTSGMECVRAVDATDLDWSDRSAFWKSRFSVLQGRVEAGTTIVHTDLDAFWLAPAEPLLDRCPDDLVFTREYGLPTHIVAKWGFVLCCGFFRAAPSPGTRAFFEAWRRYVDRFGDDQVAVNRLLHDRDIRWAAVDFEGGRAHRGRLEIGGEPVSFLVLPDDRFSRTPPYQVAGIVVSHPYFEKRNFDSYMSLYRWMASRGGRLNDRIVPAAFLASAPAAMKPRDAATLSMLRRLVAEVEADAAVWRHLADLERQMGDSAAALAAIEHALRSRPDDPLILLLAAEIHLAGGRREEARPHLRRIGAAFAGQAAVPLRRRHLAALWAAGLAASAMRMSFRKDHLLDRARRAKRSVFGRT